MSEQWAVIKAAVVALLVAALIWIWAEGESLSTRQTEPIELRLPDEPTNDLAIRADDPGWNGTIRVRLEGSVRAVDDAVDRLGKQIRLPVVLEGMPTTPVTRFPLKLRELISRMPALANSAGIVAEVTPAEILVTAERMVTRQLPVRVELATPVPLDGEPVATPPAVSVRLTEAAAVDLGPDAAVIAVVPEADLIRARAEGPLTVSLPVRRPAGVGAGSIVTPDAVSVSVRIKQAIDTVRLPTVPVWFSLPPTEDGAQWSIEILDKFLTDVTISGASEDVQRVRNGQIPVKAVIEFSSDELERVAAQGDRNGSGIGLAPAPGTSGAPAAGTGTGGGGVAPGSGAGTVTKQAAFSGLPPGVTASVVNGAVRVKVTRRSGNP